MRVCFVGPYTLPLSIAGFQSQVFHIYEGLKKKGVDVEWYSFEKNNLEGVDVLQVMQAEYSMIHMMKRAKNKGIKVVLTPMHGSRFRSNSYLKSCLFLSRFPQLCTTHKQMKSVINTADYLTPLCSYEAKRMVDVYGFNENKMKTIPNGIDDIFFNDIATRVNLPLTDYLLVVGRVEKNKNQRILIEAANTLNMNLIIVGEPGADGDSYLNMCKKIAGKNVCFWGLEKDPKVLKYLYRNAVLTVIPSFSEMVPLVAFESLSQKTPVVCTNRCGIADDIIPGLFFTDLDKQSIVRSIITALQFSKNYITSEGIYTWDDIAGLYKDVYVKLLEK